MGSGKDQEVEAGSEVQLKINRSVTAWRETRRQLALQAWAAESDARRELQSQRCLSQDQLAELRSYMQQSEDERQVWEQDLWSGMSKMRKRVAALGANMRFAPSREDVRSMVSSADHEFQMYSEKARQQFDELTAAECGLEESLQVSLARFEGWCSQESALRQPSSSTPLRRRASTPSVGSSQKAAKPRGHRTSTPSAEMEIRSKLEELTVELDAGGPTGGWASEDHEAFMKLLRRFKRRATAEFLVEAERLLPHRSHEALVAHAKWFNDREKHQAQRRDLLDEWRSLKVAEKMRTASEVPARRAEEQSCVEEAREERRRRSEMRQQELQEQAARRREVEAWRKQKEEEQKAAEQSRHREEQQVQEQEALARQRLKEAKQQELEAFRRQREDEEQARELAAQTPARRLTQEEQRRIAERNSALVRQRELKRRQMEEKRKPATFEPAPRAFGHVQSRLQSHTEAYVDRAREIQEAEEADKSSAASKYGVIPGNFAHQGVIRTTRSSPSWRQGFGV